MTGDRTAHAAADHRRGLIYGLAAYGLWGLFPLYWPLLEPADALEILALRMLCSLVVVAVLLQVTHGWREVGVILASPGQRWRLAVAAAFVSVNWGVYIWGVNSHHILETSLGYFINPLFTIVLGVVVLHERLRRVQWIAVGVAAVAIVVITVDYGRPPWIALTLAFSFGIYGFLKKRVSVGAVPSLAIETGFMAVPAMLVLGVLGAQGSLTVASHGAGHAVLLAGTGVITAVPLLFFGSAARRLPLTVIGLLQYLAPVLQFAVGVGIEHEPFPPAEFAGFGLVWVALVILSVDALRTPRRQRAEVLAAAHEPV